MVNMAKKYFDIEKPKERMVLYGMIFKIFRILHELNFNKVNTGPVEPSVEYYHNILKYVFLEKTMNKELIILLT